MAAVDIRIRFDRTTIAVGLALIVIGVVAFLAYRDSRPPAAGHTQLPSSALSDTGIAVYAPVNPPAGFSLDQGSISSTSEAFVYAYNYPGNKALAITIQPLPKNLDPQKFNPDKEVQTRIGRAYIVDLETRTTAAVVTEESLIFINAPQKIAVEDLEQFINSMRRAQ